MQFACVKELYIDLRWKGTQRRKRRYRRKMGKRMVHTRDASRLLLLRARRSYLERQRKQNNLNVQFHLERLSIPGVYVRVSSVIDASIFLFAVLCLGVAMCARVVLCVVARSCGGRGQIKGGQAETTRRRNDRKAGDSFV